MVVARRLGGAPGGAAARSSTAARAAAGRQRDAEVDLLGRADDEVASEARNEAINEAGAKLTALRDLHGCLLRLLSVLCSASDAPKMAGDGANLAEPDRHLAGPDRYLAGPDRYLAGSDRHLAGSDRGGVTGADHLWQMLRRVCAIIAAHGLRVVSYHITLTTSPSPITNHLMSICAQNELKPPQLQRSPQPRPQPSFTCPHPHPHPHPHPGCMQWRVLEQLRARVGNTDARWRRQPHWPLLPSPLHPHRLLLLLLPPSNPRRHPRTALPISTDQLTPTWTLATAKPVAPSTPTATSSSPRLPTPTSPPRRPPWLPPRRHPSPRRLGQPRARRTSRLEALRP